MVGRDVGLGAWGEDGASVLSIGVRYAEFNSSSTLEIFSDPDHFLPPHDMFKYDRDWRHYDVDVAATREFTGAGPTLSWDASSRLIEGDDAGRVSLDWALTGGMLFGRQKTKVVEETSGREITGTTLETDAFRDQYEHTIQETVQLRDDSESVQIPTVGASLGLSYALDRLKVGAGYRWERYFDVIDGGYRERSEYNRTVDGPYFKVSIGFGG